MELCKPYPIEVSNEQRILVVPLPIGPAANRFFVMVSRKQMQAAYVNQGYGYDAPLQAARHDFESLNCERPSAALRSCPSAGSSKVVSQNEPLPAANTVLRRAAKDPRRNSLHSLHCVCDLDAAASFTTNSLKVHHTLWANLAFQAG